MELTKIYVNATYKKNGDNSQKLVVWAAFRIRQDALVYADKVKAENPKWTVIVSNS